jgi:ribosomal protein L37AE/L43A
MSNDKLHCPICKGHLIKGDLALGAWKCLQCKTKWFILKISKPKKEIFS